MPGSSLTVLAAVGQGTTANLSCQPVLESGTDNPTFSVVVTGALGVSVNEFNSGYSNFNLLSPGPT